MLASILRYEEIYDDVTVMIVVGAIIYKSLQQKEKDDDQLVVKLQNEQAFLLSRLVELGATGYVESISPEPTNNGTQDQTTSSILNTEIMVSHTLTPTNSSGGIQLNLASNLYSSYLYCQKH